MNPGELEQEINEANCNVWHIEHLARAACEAEDVMTSAALLEVIVQMAERVNAAFGNIAVKVGKLESAKAGK